MATSTTTAKASDPAVRPSQEFLDRLIDGYGPRDFTVRFWDGTTRGPDAGRESRFTLVLNHAGAVKRMFTPPVQLSIGEAYIFSDYDIEGDLEAFWDLIDHWVLFRMRAKVTDLLKLRWQIFRLPGGGPERTGWTPPELTGEEHNQKR